MQIVIFFMLSTKHFTLFLFSHKPARNIDKYRTPKFVLAFTSEKWYILSVKIYPVV